MITLPFILVSYTMLSITVMNSIILLEMEIFDKTFVWLVGFGITMNVTSPWRDSLVHAVLCCCPPTAGCLLYGLFGLLLFKVSNMT